MLNPGPLMHHTKPGVATAAEIVAIIGEREGGSTADLRAFSTEFSNAPAPKGVTKPGRACDHRLDGEPHGTMDRCPPRAAEHIGAPKLNHTPTGTECTKPLVA